MTLARLIDAVGAGTARPGQYGHPDVMFMEVWPPTVSGPQLWQYASKAYDGSLDAAKRLHDALLPGWAWTIHQSGAAIVRRDAGGKPYGGPIRNVEAMEPARAFLLAILRALDTKGGDA